MSAIDLPPFEDPRRVLSRHQLRPKRGFSQNFLVARSAVERITDAVDAGPADLVVELGPGLGTLTTELLRRGARVVAVEQDRDMIEVLEAELGHVPTLRVERGDATTVDLTAIAAEADGKVCVAGNLPYSVTGSILKNLIRHREAYARAVVMVQKEVRDRLLAKPGEKAYGALTVFTTAALEVRSVCIVSKGSFHPAPRVDSAVVSLVPHASIRAEETDAFRSVVKAAFGTRRKTLKNALGMIASADRVREALEAESIDPQRRGETLSVEELAGVARRLADAIVAPR